jgi:hypothetical protein
MPPFRRSSLARGSLLPACSGAFVGALIVVLAQLGSGTPLQRPLEQLERSVTRPVPQAPPAPAPRAADVWVPDRFASDPVTGQQSVVPGHWERRLPSGQLYGPPTTICDSNGCTTIPAGPRPEPRQNP